MTARLILLPPTAAALDRLNDLRENDYRHDLARRKAEKSGDWTEPLRLSEDRLALAAAFADAILAGHTYTDDQDDPRVAALEARVGTVLGYARMVEDKLAEVAERDGACVDFDEWREVWGLPLRAEAGVAALMEDDDGE